MSAEDAVAHHYAHGSLERVVLGALAASGKDLDRLVAADLGPVDEFHVGGRAATEAFAAELGFAPGMHLLDIGSGLGGPSRYFAQACGCRVTGIDLTEEYVRFAETMAARVGMADDVSYRHGSALDLPFAADWFEGAYMLHVGMNISDKAALFAGVRRVLKSGAVFGIYDVMRDGDGSLSYPLPWATQAEASFVETAATYCALLEEAGFAVQAVRSRRDFALAWFEQGRTRAAAVGGPPAVGLHLVMGKAAPQKVANMARGVSDGVIAPTEIVARAL